MHKGHFIKQEFEKKRRTNLESPANKQQINIKKVNKITRTPTSASEACMMITTDVKPQRTRQEDVKLGIYDVHNVHNVKTSSLGG